MSKDCEVNLPDLPPEYKWYIKSDWICGRDRLYLKHKTGFWWNTVGSFTVRSNTNNYAHEVESAVSFIMEEVTIGECDPCRGQIIRKVNGK